MVVWVLDTWQKYEREAWELLQVQVVRETVMEVDWPALHLLLVMEKGQAGTCLLICIAMLQQRFGNTLVCILEALAAGSCIGGGGAVKHW